MRTYSKSVLLVDDSGADRELFTRELTRLGFDVIPTSSPEEAMAAIMRGNVGCLITDQIMSVPGQELASLASGIRKDLPVVLLSGASGPREPVPANVLFIQKDDREGLRAAVLKCMEPWHKDPS